MVHAVLWVPPACCGVCGCRRAGRRAGGRAGVTWPPNASMLLMMDAWAWTSNVGFAECSRSHICDPSQGVWVSQGARPPERTEVAAGQPGAWGGGSRARHSGCHAAALTAERRPRARTGAHPHTCSLPSKAPVARRASDTPLAPKLAHLKGCGFSTSRTSLRSAPSSSYTCRQPVLRAYKPAATKRAVPGIQLRAGGGGGGPGARGGGGRGARSAAHPGGTLAAAPSRLQHPRARWLTVCCVW